MQPDPQPSEISRHQQVAGTAPGHDTAAEAADARYRDLLQSVAAGGFTRLPGDDTGPH
jgi:hypothetical protein